jgi:hypothetical protein
MNYQLESLSIKKYGKNSGSFPAGIYETSWKYKVIQSIIFYILHTHLIQIEEKLVVALQQLFCFFIIIKILIASIVILIILILKIRKNL